MVQHFSGQIFLATTHQPVIQQMLTVAKKTILPSVQIYNNINNDTIITTTNNNADSIRIADRRHVASHFFFFLSTTTTVAAGLEKWQKYKNVYHFVLVYKIYKYLFSCICCKSISYCDYFQCKTGSNMYLMCYGCPLFVSSLSVSQLEVPVHLLMTLLRIVCAKRITQEASWRTALSSVITLQQFYIFWMD